LVVCELILNNYYQWVETFKNAKNNEITYFNNIPFNPIKLLQNVYVNLSKLQNKQISYINCIGKFNKSKLWCDVVGDYL